MSRTRDTGEICALCDEFDVDHAAPDCAARGMGLCLKAEQGKPRVHVAWDGRTCVSFRLDKPNLQRRRQFVAVQRRAHQASSAAGSTETTSRASVPTAAPT